MDLNRIKEVLESFIAEKGMKVFEIAYHKKDATLAVLLDENLSMDELEKISNEISDHLDQYEDEFEDNYFLDVSTVGAERPIRNADELQAAVGSYIFVKDADRNEYYGDLLSFDGETLSMEVKEKNKKKNVSLLYEKVKKVRYAVRF